MEKPGTGDGSWSNFSVARARARAKSWPVSINLLLRSHINAERSIRHQRNGASKYVIRYSRANRRRRRVGEFTSLLAANEHGDATNACALLALGMEMQRERYN